MGSQVITNAGGVPGAPTLLKPGSLTAALSNLEGSKSNSNNSADQSAQKSGFSDKNSGQPANAANFNPNLPPNTNNNTLTNAVSFSNPAGQPVGNSTLQNQKTLTTNTLTTTTPTTTTPTTTTPTTNNNPSPPPASPTRTTQTLTGYAGGLVVITQSGGGDSPSSSTRVRSLGQPGSISIATDATNNTATGTIVVGLNGSHHHPATATLQLGGAGSSTFTDDKNYTMTNNLSRRSTVKIGDTPYPVDPVSTLASTSSSACTCEFLSFGAWVSSVADPKTNGKTYTAIGTYVAGTPTTSVQLPQTGSAIYSGFMAGFASNNGVITAPTPGTYRNDWNFQTRSGVFNGSFDNRSYSGTTQATGSGPAFTGRFSGGGGSGRLNGSFFASPSDPAAYQAGSFSIGTNRSSYQASGVFAGQRP
jgi:hypothetical protein